MGFDEQPAPGGVAGGVEMANSPPPAAGAGGAATGPLVAGGFPSNDTDRPTTCHDHKQGLRRVLPWFEPSRNGEGDIRGVGKPWIEMLPNDGEFDPAGQFGNGKYKPTPEADTKEWAYRQQFNKGYVHHRLILTPAAVTVSRATNDNTFTDSISLEDVRSFQVDRVSRKVLSNTGHWFMASFFNSGRNFTLYNDLMGIGSFICLVIALYAGGIHDQHLVVVTFWMVVAFLLWYVWWTIICIRNHLRARGTMNVRRGNVVDNGSSKANADSLDIAKIVFHIVNGLVILLCVVCGSSVHWILNSTQGFTPVEAYSINFQCISPSLPDRYVFPGWCASDAFMRSFKAYVAMLILWVFTTLITFLVMHLRAYPVLAEKIHEISVVFRLWGGDNLKVVLDASMQEELIHLFHGHFRRAVGHGPKDRRHRSDWMMIMDQSLKFFGCVVLFAVVLYGTLLMVPFIKYGM